MKKSFTFVEVIITITIVSLISIAVIPRLVDQRSVAREAARIAWIGQIQLWLESYNLVYNSYPIGNCITDIVQPLVNSWKIMSELPGDPDSKHLHYWSLTWSCLPGVYVYQNLPNSFSNSGNQGYVISANMEKYSNLNYVLTGKYDSTIWQIRSNKCDKVSKWIWLCKTDDLLHSGTYILLSNN